MNGAICGGYGVLERRIRFCPTEQAERRMVGASAAWYGTTWTCLGCGDRWQDGERGSRPFARGWRQRSIEQASRLYALALSGAAARSALDRYLRESL